MDGQLTETPKKKVSKADAGEKEKKKKLKGVSNVNEFAKEESKVEGKTTKKRKAGERNEDNKPEKAKKKPKTTSATKSTLPSKVAATEEKHKKRKRDSKEEASSEKKKKSRKDTKPTIPEELEIDITAPNPPSKKALRLQKKGKPVPKLPSTSLPPTDPSTAATSTDTTHPDRQKLVKEIPRADWSVWIGNLSYKSDVKGLRGWLVRGDKRVTDKDITRINLPLNADGQSKGFAYVDFLTQDAMERVISRSEENFDGRNLLIKNGKSFDGRPAERKQRYQVKSAVATGGRMSLEGDEAQIRENKVKDLNEVPFQEKKEKKEKKRTRDEKAEMPKKSKRDT